MESHLERMPGLLSITVQRSNFYFNKTQSPGMTLPESPVQTKKHVAGEMPWWKEVDKMNRSQKRQIGSCTAFSGALLGELETLSSHSVLGRPYLEYTTVSSQLHSSRKMLTD